MSHTQQDQAKLLARVRRLTGQMQALERALQASAPCGDVLQQLASIRGALNGLTAEVMDGHLREHVLDADSDAARAQAVEELSTILRTYVR